MLGKLAIFVMLGFLASIEAKADPCTAFSSADGVVLKCDGNWTPMDCPQINTNCDKANSGCGEQYNIICSNLAVGDPPPDPPPNPPSPPSPPGVTNTAETVNTAVTTQNATTVQHKAEGSGGSQTSSLKAADEVTTLGANQLATVAAIFCAQGANRAYTNQPGADDDIVACKGQYRAAQLMQSNLLRMGKDGSLIADPATMAQEGTKSTLDEFEKNFGIGPDEYMKKMLGKGGGPGGAFSDMLSSKLGADKIDSLVNVAVPDGEKFAVNLGSGISTKRAPSSSALRADLKKRLADSGGNRATAAEPGPTHIAPPVKQLEDMTPLAGIFSQKAEPAELTIFGVVHLKYVQIRHLWGRR